MNYLRKTSRVTLLSQTSCFAIALVLLSASGAVAQSTANAPPEGASAPAKSPAAAPLPTTADAASTVGEVTVTASRVNRTGYEAPTPTVVIGQAELEQRATTNVGALLDELPSFRPTTQPSSNGAPARAAGSIYLDLRGLGTSRTLVLVDNQRFVPEMDAGLVGYNVNLNQIPELLVDHIEVVTGGASAQWGSDAIAGVVNIILKKNFEGFQGEIQGGESKYSDDKQVRIGFLAGHNFLDDRLNVEVSLDFARNDGVGDATHRPWENQENYLISNPCPNHVAISAACPAGGNGLGTRLIAPNVQYSTFSPGGLITNTALKGTNFGPGGSIIPFTYGNYVGGTQMSGGGQPGVNFPENQSIEGASTRASGYGRVSYALTPDINAHAELSYAYSKGEITPFAYMGTSTIKSDNAYIPTALAGLIATDKITSFTLGRENQELVPQGIDENKTVRTVLGLDGKFGSEGDWKWSANVGYGRNMYAQTVFNNAIPAHYAFASDAVSSNGQIVCRATLPGPSFNAAAAGCVPINLFGTTGVTPAALAYVAGTTRADIDYDQLFADATISGEPFKTWAGPVSTAFGVDYRHETEDADADPIANASGYFSSNSASFKGTNDVKEIFGETVVPLLKDSAFGESLDLNGALRYAQYEGAAGGQPTWKYGLTYRPPLPGLLLRAAESRDIRAPNIFERGTPPSSRAGIITYLTASPSVLVESIGNPNLQPEKSDTTTYGFSYQPSFAPGLAFSVDHYAIDIKGAITTLAGQDVANECSIGHVQSFCNLITFDGNGTPTAISTPFLNLAQVNVAGFDIEASYRFALDRIFAGAPGTISLNFAGNYTEHSEVNSGLLGAKTIDRAGELGPINQFAVPRFRSTTSVNYTNDKWSVNVQARQISSGKYDNTFTAADINDNNISGRTYFDLSGTYDIGHGITLFGVINNLFDRDPPTDPTANASTTNAIYFDTIGRVFLAGVRIKMR